MDASTTRTGAVLSYTYAAAATVLRILPTLLLVPYNFAPVGALGLFGGARLRSWVAFGLPLAVMVLTDLCLWALKGPDYSPLHMSRGIVYPCFLLYVALGRWIGSSNNPLRIGSACLLGSLGFFVITNFADWLILSDRYARDLSGLVECYVAAIPFHRGTLTSDVLFTAVFFGIHAALVRAARPAPVPQVLEEVRA